MLHVPVSCDDGDGRVVGSDLLESGREIVCLNDEDCAVATATRWLEGDRRWRGEASDDSLFCTRFNFPHTRPHHMRKQARVTRRVEYTCSLSLLTIFVELPVVCSPFGYVGDTQVRLLQLRMRHRRSSCCGIGPSRTLIYADLLQLRLKPNSRCSFNWNNDSNSLQQHGAASELEQAMHRPRLG